MGPVVGALVGPLVGPLVEPLVDPLVGRGSLSPALRRKSESQGKSRSYGPKVGVTAGETCTELNHPEKEPEWGLGASTEKAPLKPSWFPLR